MKTLIFQYVTVFKALSPVEPYLTFRAALVAGQCNYYPHVMWSDRD